ncbi:MAG: hypothetical protein K8T90_21925 [Planctomycetes bacterium]|nr:hypothetical protein [Planctomycetota bacterium]
MTAVVATAAEPDDGDAESALDREPCACGRLAAVVIHEDGDGVWVAVGCECGSFVPAAASFGGRP